MDAFLFRMIMPSTQFNNLVPLAVFHFSFFVTMMLIHIWAEYSQGILGLTIKPTVKDTNFIAFPYYLIALSEIDHAKYHMIL